MKGFIGELTGTFILVLFGCGSVAVSILFGAYTGILQIGISWGIGVMLAIYLTRHLSCAHLNPAVSIGMVIAGRMSLSKLPVYFCAQFAGAILAGLSVYLLFSSTITAWEAANQIVRGTPASVATAKMFGEYYAVEGSMAVVSMPLAISAEAFGTFLLMFFIFALTEGCNVGRPDMNLAPVFIGMSVTAIICLIAPLTQAGLNPARDFGPRMVAWLFGWGDAAFPDGSGGFFWVYIAGPVIGSSLSALLFVTLYEPLMKKKQCCNLNSKKNDTK
ncbi:MAG: MIP/aquaporin family protein [Mangrovibacterium sp.]